MPKTKSDDPHEQGYIGAVAEQPPNEAYSVSADHEDTAERERDALRERRHQREDAVREENKQTAAKPAAAKSPPKDSDS